MTIKSISDLLLEDAHVSKQQAEDVASYILELIRVSKMYEFKVEVKKRTKNKHGAKQSKQDTEVQPEPVFTNINPEIALEKPKYQIVEQQPIDLSYSTTKELEILPQMAYGAEKPKMRKQELHEKTGFYQERTTQAKVRVQLWPEHLPYDHFKRKKGFLFC